MKCPIENPENAGLLLAYWARKLDPETAGVLERHMETCPACQALHDDQKAVWEALDAWEAPPVSEDFDRRLYGRIEAAAQSSWWERVARWFRPVRIGPGLPLAAAVCLLVMAWIILERPNHVASPEAAQPAVEAVQADQVERTLEDMEMLRGFQLAARGEAQPSSSM